MGIISTIPSSPEAAGAAIVEYDPRNGPLTNSRQCYLRWGYNNWSLKIEPDDLMTFEADRGIWIIPIMIPQNARSLHLCVHDGTGNWDNNGWENWMVKINKNRLINHATAHKAAATRQLQLYNELMGIMQNSAFHQDMQAALDHHFQVLVLATMSSGKSTLLNALLGFDLLPSKNEACTEIVYRLEDCDGMTEFQCRAVLGETILDEWQPASRQLLEQWNNSGLCTLVEIQGDLPFVKNQGAQLVLFDTPGPNYSRDDRHAKVMRNIMSHEDYGVILFVLNANQLGTNDERILLDEVLQISNATVRGKKKQVVFVLNKVDEFDEENGDSLVESMHGVKAYLKEIGFLRPVIVPIMARAAKLFRIAANGGNLTRSERHDLLALFDKLKQDPFRLLRPAKLQADVRTEIECGIRGESHTLLAQQEDSIRTINIDNQRLERRELEIMEYATGIHTIETILENHLYSRAMPETMQRIAKILQKHGADQLLQWIHNAAEKIKQW